MDSQAVNSVGNPKPPTAPKPQPASSSSAKAVAAPDPKPSGNSVDVPAQAKALAEVGDRQRKFSVTENNDVVLQVIDPTTQKVIKSVPSEAEMQLKDAIRNSVSDITE